MKFMPEKNIRNLLKVLGYYTAVLYVALLLTHIAVGSRFTARSLMSLAAVASVATLVAGTGFWLEGRFFFPIYSAGLIVGTLYMVGVAVFNSAPGWGDLTSLIGFGFIAAAGAGLGLAAEFVRYLLRPVLKRD